MNDFFEGKLAIIIEHEDGRIGFETVAPSQHGEPTQPFTELDALAGLLPDRPNNRGIIAIEDVPAVPTGGNRNDLIWDGQKLAYGTKYAGMFLRHMRNGELKKTDIDTLIALETNHTDLAAIKAYRQSLRDLGVTIDANPASVKYPDDFPVNPVPNGVKP